VGIEGANYINTWGGYWGY